MDLDSASYGKFTAARKHLRPSRRHRGDPSLHVARSRLSTSRARASPRHAMDAGNAPPDADEGRGKGKDNAPPDADKGKGKGKFTRNNAKTIAELVDLGRLVFCAIDDLVKPLDTDFPPPEANETNKIIDKIIGCLLTTVFSLYCDKKAITSFIGRAEPGIDNCLELLHRCLILHGGDTVRSRQPQLRAGGASASAAFDPPNVLEGDASANTNGEDGEDGEDVEDGEEGERTPKRRRLN